MWKFLRSGHICYLLGLCNWILGLCFKVKIFGTIYVHILHRLIFLHTIEESCVICYIRKLGGICIMKVRDDTEVKVDRHCPKFSLCTLER